MIEIRSSEVRVGEWKTALVGIGGAGCNMLELLVREPAASASTLAVHTETRRLSGSSSPNKMVIGQTVTRGLGAGGDPLVGYHAAEAGAGSFLEAVRSAKMVILLAGLGGGTGSGVVPYFAAVARSAGIQVVSIVTVPFAFEGARRNEQASQALEELSKHSDAVICFENDRMHEVVGTGVVVDMAFQQLNRIIAETVKALVGITQRRGILHVGIDEVSATVAGKGTTALFGHAVSDGEGRAKVVVDQALKSPLMQGGHDLRDAVRVFAHLVAGPDFRWEEAESVMSDLRSRVPAHIETFFGLAVDGALAGRVGLTLIAGIAAGTPRRERRKEPESSESVKARRALAGEQDLPFEEPPTEVKAAPSEERKTASGEVVVGVLGSAAERIASHWRKGEVSGGLVNAPAASAVPLGSEPERPAASPITSAGSAGSTASPAAPSPSAGIVTKPAKSWSAYLAEASAEQAVAASAPAPRAESVPSAPASPASSRADEASRRGTSEMGALRPPASSSAPTGVQSAAAQSPLKKAPAKPGSGGVEPEQMQFEPVQRGHFQETSQTVIDGQDLDVPTFLRRRSGQK